MVPPDLKIPGAGDVTRRDFWKANATMLGLGILFVIIVVFFAACSSEPPVETGYVRDKSFEPAHWEDGYETYYRSEMRCRPVSSYSSYTKSYTYSTRCSTAMVPYQVYEEHHSFEPDRWKLFLENCDKKDDKGKTECRDGWKTVDQTTYHKYEVGNHYPDAR